jgi:hypothetical protein
VKRTFLALMVMALLGAWACGQQSSSVEEGNGQGQPQQQQAAKPEPKPEPKTEPKTEPKPESKPEPKPEPEPTIPGLMPVDVYGNLERQGFDCVGPDSVGPDQLWTCTSREGTNEQMVEIWGPDAGSVRYVEAVVLTSDANMTPILAGELFPHVATIPYEGAQPLRAQAWAREHAGTASEAGDASTTIGGAKFTIYAMPTEFSQAMEIAPAGG